MAGDGETPQIERRTGDRRLCVVTNDDAPASGRAMRLAETLASRGDPVECLTTSPTARADDFVENGVRVVRLAQQGPARGDVGFGRWLRDAAFVVRTAIALVSRPACDVVLLHVDPVRLGWFAFVPRSRGAKVFVDVPAGSTSDADGLVDRLRRWADRRVLVSADTVFCRDDRQRVALVAGGVEPSNVRVVMDVPDERVWRAPAPEADRFADPFLVACRGGLEIGGTAEALVHSVAKLQDRMPRLRLRLLGGAGIGRLQQLGDELGVADRLEFFDTAIPAEDVATLLADVDLGVVPAGDDQGALVRLMEYALLGVPVVAPHCPILVEASASPMAQLVMPRDTNDLVTAVWDLARDPARRRVLTANAARYASAHSWARERQVIFDSIDDTAAA